MANLIRSAKSGSDWGLNDLNALHIEVKARDMQTFFQIPQLPAATVSPVLLNNLNMPNTPMTKQERQFFQRLQLTMMPYYEESKIDDFASLLFSIYGLPAVPRSGNKPLRSHMHIIETIVELFKVFLRLPRSRKLELRFAHLFGSHYSEVDTQENIRTHMD